MRIDRYKVRLERETKRTELIKECSVNYKTCQKLNNPKAIYDALNDILDVSSLAEEHVYMLAFNTGMRLLGLFEVTHGQVDQSIISAREIYNRALLVGATQIIILHNHPSGDANPSKADIEFTERLRKAGEILGVPLIDHIVAGDNGYVSFLEEGLLKQGN